MTPRPKRVLVYTLALLLAPVPLMPFEPGSRPFVLTLFPSMSVLVLAGVYVIRGELPAKGRPLYATKLLIAATMTSITAVLVLAFALLWLQRT
jgi:hypothetical protein